MQNSGAKWLKGMQKEWRFTQEEAEIAALAAQQLDVVHEANEAIRKNGMMTQGRYGLVVNPAIETARKASETHARLIKALKPIRKPKQHVGRPSMYDDTWRQ